MQKNTLLQQQENQNYNKYSVQTNVYRIQDRNVQKYWTIIDLKTVDGKLFIFSDKCFPTDNIGIISNYEDECEYNDYKLMDIRKTKFDKSVDLEMLRYDFWPMYSDGLVIFRKTFCSKSQFQQMMLEINEYIPLAKDFGMYLTSNVINTKNLYEQVSFVEDYSPENQNDTIFYLGNNTLIRTESFTLFSEYDQNNKQDCEYVQNIKERIKIIGSQYRHKERLELKINYLTQNNNNNKNFIQKLIEKFI